MSALGAVPIDLVRAVAVTSVATAAGAALTRVATRPAARALLVAWLAMPTIAIAYAWAALPLAWLHTPRGAGLAHLVLSALRLAPIACAIAAIAPAPPWSAHAVHVARLARRRWRLRALVSGPARRWLIAALILAVPAFAEFEVAARLGVPAWAVRLFDAQAGGQPVTATLRDALPGMAVQAGALVAAWLLLRRRGDQLEQTTRPPGTPSALGWLVVTVGTGALVALPIARIAVTARGGWSSSGGLGVAHEIGATAVIAVAAASCALALAGALAARPRPLALAIALTPGLAGSLVVGLALLAATRPWPALADSPVPLLTALVLLALPVATTVRALIARADGGRSAHVVDLLAGGDASQRRARERRRWHGRGRALWLAWSLVMAWCAGDLAASTILHPVGMTPALVLLYNFMHYGETAALSARLVAAASAPVAIAAIAWPLARAGHRLAYGWRRG